MKFIIEGTLPSLNDYIRAERGKYGKFNAARMKSENQEYIVWCIRKARIRKAKGPVYIKYTYYEPTKRRDKDNIAAPAHKFIQDALVAAGIIKNDSWDYVTGFSDEFHIDNQHPRIEVTLEEVSNGSQEEHIKKDQV